MNAKHRFRARALRVALAFVAFLSTVVLIPGAPRAGAAPDDLTIAVAVDNSAISYGSVSGWTLTVDTSAAVTLASGIVVTDTLPDGLCPYGAGDPDCAGGVAPSPAYDSATENTDGTWTLVWNLADMGPSSQTVITFSTETRSNYQEGFADDTPILARDSWNNTARVDGDVDGTPITDVASVGQSAAGVIVAEDIASRPAALVQPEVCGDGSAFTWIGVAASGYRIGDQVCWRVSVDYPVDLTTADSQISFAVPTGQDFTAADTWAAGAGNTVPGADIDGSAVVAGAGTLVWDIGDAGGYVGSGERVEVVFSTTIADPSATSSGQNVTSITYHTHHTTPGSTITTSDSAIVQVLEAELDLTKGVILVNGVSTGGSIDGVIVKETDLVTYQLAVTNAGDIDAGDIVVWDLLPDLLAPCSAQISSISDGGACDDGANRVEWTGASVISVAAGATTNVTYDATIPTGIAPETTLGNHAGVVSYTSTTNNDPFTYVPSSNIDSGAGSPNTTSADDTSSVVTPSVSIGSSRVTGVDEAGNNASSQATIGELITYTLTVVIPEGTTVWDAQLVDDLPANLDLVSSGHSFDGEQALVLTEDGAADSVTIDFPSPSYQNASGTGDDTLTVTIIARVIDIPANSRGTSIGNSASLTWLDQDSASHTKSTSVSTTVVEPLLSIAKSSVDSIGNNGTVVGDEIVDYTITITNPGTSNVSTAHELAIVDTLPEGVTVTFPVPDSGVWVADGTPGDGIGGTITWSVSSLSSGSSLVRTYQVTVDDPVIVNSTFVNTVTVDSSSMSGTPAVERSSGTGYHDEDNRILTTPLASLTRSVSPDRATIGDVVTYSLEVTMPPGTIMYDGTVIDTLPGGMEFDGLVSSSCDMNGVPCDPMITAVEIGVAGTTTAAFFLGDLDASSTTGEDRVVTIEYEAHLLDAGSAGDTRVSSASVYGNQTDQIAGTPGSVPLPSSFDVTVGPVADTVTVVEPDLAVDKDVAGQTGDGDYRRAAPGETLIYTIVASNANTAYISNAYDLVIVDTLPEGLDPTLPIADGGVWAADAIPGDGVGGTITWAAAGPVAPGGTVTRTYQATVNAGLDSGDEDVGNAEAPNTVDVTSYFGVSSADRAAHPGFAYREYDDVPPDTVQVEFDLASIGGTVWFDVDADGAIEAGEPRLAGIDVTFTYLGLDGVASGDDEVHLDATASDGYAAVEDLPGGSYTVVVDAADLPAGLVPAYDLDDGTLTPDGRWGPGPLAENEDKLNVDFGYTGDGSIGGTVWFDSDGDGLVGGSEYGLEGIGITVTWLGIDGVSSGDDVAYQISTDATGGYLVSRLPAGNYSVIIDDLTVPAGMEATYDTDGVGTPGSTMVILGAGTDDPGEDFGYAGPGTLGDFVWLDRDGDGVQDVTEPGIEGVPIQLTWPGEDGVLGGGDDELFLTTTDSDGLYTFTYMPPGEYLLTVLGGLPAAAPSTYDEDGGNDAAATVNLGYGEVHVTADFGFHGTASIGDTVWWDIDGDGILDVGEPGIPGIGVQLTYAGLDGTLGNSDDLVFSDITDGAGSFLFSDLPAGNFEVAIDSGIPGGMAQTYDENGGLDGTSTVTGLTVDEIYLSADFGYMGTGSIGDFIWLDLDSNGIQDVAEPGLPVVDVEVTWFGVDGVLATSDDVVLATSTDIDGNYAVADLPAGDYEVTIDPASLPVGVVPTYDPDGLASPNSSLLTLAPGDDDPDQDFGYDGGSVIGDLVWFDQNDDGIKDTSEYGIAGVSLDLIWAGPDGVHATADDETFTMTTDGVGEYLAVNLPEGEYAVVVDPASLPAGMVGACDEDGVLDDQTLFAVAQGELHRSADFGYRGTGLIGDLVWFDADGDGSLGGTESGIPRQTVELTAAGPDNVLGTGDDQDYITVTGTEGGYVFANLPPADYAVAVNGGIESSAGNTSDEDGDHDSYVAFSLGDGEVHDGADFGYLGSAQVGDLVWLDLDADGTHDAIEPGMPGIAVTVTWLGEDGVTGGEDDLVVAVETTDADGMYAATGLPAGNLEAAVSGGVANGLGNTGDPDGSGDGRAVVTGLAGGSTELGIDFGYAGAGAVGDSVFWDLNGDGMESVGEPGVADLELVLTWVGFDDEFDTGDDATWIAVSASDGSYAFGNLPPGGYRVVVETDGLPPGVVPVSDPDDEPDGISFLTVGPYEWHLEQDFGFRGGGSVAGSIWIDVDSDGDRGSTEPGLGSGAVTVSYLGPDEPGGVDVAFEVALTDTGDYELDGLPSGFFEVEVDVAALPEGIELADGVVNPVQIVVGSGSAVFGVDFRAVGNASLTGVVWNDRDGDEVSGESEVGIAAVGVDVVWEYPEGAVVLRTETDAFGAWEIESLPPGLYDAAIDALSVPVGMGPTTPASMPVVLEAGDVGVADFGIALRLGVGSSAWIDESGNGVVDSGEPGVSGILINLYDDIGRLVAITETNDAGAYSFGDLFPGLYSVQVDYQSVPAGLRPTWDRDGVADLLTSLDLTEGVHILDANFGFQVGLPLTGFDVDALAIWGAMLTLFGLGLVLATQRAANEGDPDAP